MACMYEPGLPPSRWKKIQDPEEMKEWIREGYTYAECARRHEEKYGIALTRAGVEYFARAVGMKRRMDKSVYGHIPWIIQSRHSSNSTSQRVFAWSKLVSGKELTPLVIQDFHDWNSTRLAAGAVLYYDPRTEHGWIFVKARPGKDKGLFRDLD